MPDTYIDPTADQVRAVRDLEVEGPLVMLNLLRFNEGGEARYQAYGEAAAPFLKQSGATIRYLGKVMATVIGGDAWDEVILVEYPSKEAFLGMIAAEGYPSEMRASALADSRLYLTRAPG